MFCLLRMLIRQMSGVVCLVNSYKTYLLLTMLSHVLCFFYVSIGFYIIEFICCEELRRKLKIYNFTDIG